MQRQIREFTYVWNLKNKTKQNSWMQMRTYKNFNIIICSLTFEFLQLELWGFLQRMALFLELGNCLQNKKSFCAFWLMLINNLKVFVLPVWTRAMMMTNAWPHDTHFSCITVPLADHWDSQRLKIPVVPANQKTNDVTL